MASVAGRLLRVKFNDKYIKCQLDATLTFTNNYEEEESCKPEDETLISDGDWVTRVLESQDHSLSVNSRLFLDALEGAALTQADLVALNIAGDVYGEAEFMTTPGQHNEANDLIITLPVVISSIELAAPGTGRATSSYEFQGNGKPTQSLIPVAP